MSAITFENRKLIRARRSAAAQMRAARDPAVAMTPALLAALSRLTANGALTENEREAWTDNMIVGRSPAAISQTMGLSRQRVSQLVASATDKLSTELIRDPAVDYPPAS